MRQSGSLGWSKSDASKRCHRLGGLRPQGRRSPSKSRHPNTVWRRPGSGGISKQVQQRTTVTCGAVAWMWLRTGPVNGPLAPQGCARPGLVGVPPARLWGLRQATPTES